MALVDAEDILDYARHEGERIGVEKGREEGLQRGRQEGLQEGAFGILENQLSRKFGPLSPDTINRLRQADTRQLQAWSLSVLDAETLEHVFKR